MIITAAVKLQEADHRGATWDYAYTPSHRLKSIYDIHHGF
jgi:hypothetical protein